MKIINDIDELKHLARDTNFECKILLNHGCFSRKLISYDPHETDGYLWCIFNHIDDTTDKYNSDEELLHRYPLFIEAIKYGALVYDPENCYV